MKCSSRGWPRSSSPSLPQVKFEPAAPVGAKSSEGMLGEAEEEGPRFPHLYGTIDYGAVVAELPVQRGPGGEFLAIEVL